MRGDDVRYNRFLVRLLLKHPEHICLSVLNGHACVASGTYKYALGKYYSLFDEKQHYLIQKYSFFR